MGRPRIDILIPAVPFTTRDLKSQNPHVSAFVIQARIEEWLSTGKIRRTGFQPRTGHGKAFFIYEAVQVPILSGAEGRNGEARE